FFLLTSSFVTNFGIKVDIPKAETGAQTESQFINVAVTKEGKFYVNGEQTEKGQLVSALREVKGSKMDSSLMLRADKDVIIDNAVRVKNDGQALDLIIVMATERSSE